MLTLELNEGEEAVEAIEVKIGDGGVRMSTRAEFSSKELTCPEIYAVHDCWQ